MEITLKRITEQLLKTKRLYNTLSKLDSKDRDIQLTLTQICCNVISAERKLAKLQKDLVNDKNT